jgi:hypothetical protein
LYEYASDEESPSRITDLGERNFLYKGKEQRFYLYKVSFSETEPYSYLGVAGPYPADKKQMKSTHSATGVHWDEEFDAKKVEEQFRAYMKMLEELEKEED